MPVEYIPRTRELYSSYTPYRWVINRDTPPWTPLRKPIGQSKIAVMSPAVSSIATSRAFIARMRATERSRKMRRKTI